MSTKNQFFHCFMKLAIGIIALLALYADCPENPAPDLYAGYKEDTNYLAEIVGISKKNPNADSVIKKITLKEMDYAILQAKCYPEVIDTAGAIVQCINKQMEKCLLWYGFNIQLSYDTLIKKMHWIDHHTKAPDKLVCVKGVYGEDTAAYLEWFVSPVIVNPLLYRNCYFSKVLNALQWQRMQQIEDSLRKGKKTLETFKEYKRWSVPNDERMEYLPFYQQVLLKLSEGEIYPGIWEDEFTYLIPRVLEKAKDSIYLDGVMLTKVNCETWMQSVAEKAIKIKWKDDKLASVVREKYPAWWEKYKKCMVR